MTWDVIHIKTNFWLVGNFGFVLSASRINGILYCWKIFARKKDKTLLTIRLLDDVNRTSSKIVKKQSAAYKLAGWKNVPKSKLCYISYVKSYVWSMISYHMWQYKVLAKIYGETIEYETGISVSSRASVDNAIASTIIVALTDC